MRLEARPGENVHPVGVLPLRPRRILTFPVDRVCAGSRVVVVLGVGLDESGRQAQKQHGAYKRRQEM